MCNKKWYDIVTVIVSVLVGAAAVAYSVKFGFTAYIMPRLAVLFGTLALLLLTLALCSLLRQDRSYNACLCHCGHKLLLVAIALLVVGTVTLIALETGNDDILRYILAFLLGALMSGTAFTATGLLSCLVEAGCPPLRLRPKITSPWHRRASPAAPFAATQNGMAFAMPFCIFVLQLLFRLGRRAGGIF